MGSQQGLCRCQGPQSMTQPRLLAKEREVGCSHGQNACLDNRAPTIASSTETEAYKLLHGSEVFLYLWIYLWRWRLFEYSSLISTPSNPDGYPIVEFPFCNCNTDNEIRFFPLNSSNISTRIMRINYITKHLNKHTKAMNPYTTWSGIAPLQNCIQIMGLKKYGLCQWHSSWENTQGTCLLILWKGTSSWFDTKCRHLQFN